jgi:hypothetical protein
MKKHSNITFPKVFNSSIIKSKDIEIVEMTKNSSLALRMINESSTRAHVCNASYSGSANWKIAI